MTFAVCLVPPHSFPSLASPPTHSRVSKLRGDAVTWYSEGKRASCAPCAAARLQRGRLTEGLSGLRAALAEPSQPSISQYLPVSPSICLFISSCVCASVTCQITAGAAEKKTKNVLSKFPSAVEGGRSADILSDTKF